MQTKERCMNKKNNESETQYMDYFKEHAAHAAEYAKNIASTIQSNSGEMTRKVADIYATNLALAKKFLNCSNFEEIVHWGENIVKTNVNHCVDSVGSMYNKVCSEITEANGDIAKKVGKNFNNLKNKF